MGGTVGLEKRGLGQKETFYAKGQEIKKAKECLGFDANHVEEFNFSKSDGKKCASSHRELI